MIRIPDQTLPKPVHDKLQTYQKIIDDLPDYPQQVKRAQEEFSKKRSTKIFRQIEGILDAMCSGTRRCMYCEDSCADEVEHIHPKHLYPDMTFIWENYLFACGICNPRKNNKFAIFDQNNQPFVLAHPSGIPPVKPPTGNPVFINPRLEEAMDFLFLDIIGKTFLLQAIPTLSTRDQERATYTINTLQLNRSELVRARTHAYPPYRALLKEFISAVTPEERNHIQEAIQGLSHITVWREMQRQYKQRKAMQRKDLAPLEFEALFDQVPEALNW
jgi:uncharacterized protein (TIGR02646 family)